MESSIKIAALSFSEEVQSSAHSVRRVQLPASKSISNRALIMGALSNRVVGKGAGEIKNLAKCDDTDVLLAALSSQGNHFDIGAAGTAMRFLTAYKCMQEGEWTITGSERMKQRPIGVLVEALRSLGAKIDYVENEGFPPLKIVGKQLEGGEIEIEGNISSQYISALLMIAPVMHKGLRIKLVGEVISKPYILMTLQMMHDMGVEADWSQPNEIIIPHQEYATMDYTVESDWSASSYWYEIVALSEQNIMVQLPMLHEKSMQGDSKVREIFQPLGVKTVFAGDGVELSKEGTPVAHYEYDFSGQPDLAQTVVVTCCVLGTTFRFTGLQTLKIKETDRIEALKNECRKLGFVLKEGELGTLYWDGERVEKESLPSIATYHDHRMAMAFAPSVLRLGSVVIENPSVVSKSYPDFWLDIASCFLFGIE